MKIKTKQKLNLPELIQYVWENEVYPNRYVNNFHRGIVFNDTGKFMTDDSFISPNSYFTVEVCEELTKSILLDRITIFFYDTQTRNNGFGTYRDLSIQEALEMNRGTLKFISMAVDDVLIWSAESGIPESGVLEVETK